MIVMPSNSSGWFWHTLARETGRLGHLYSPGGQRGPWPWLPYSLDNGAYSCWTEETNVFDYEKWAVTERAWHRLVVWAQIANIKPRWALVPDVPGNASETFDRWAAYAPDIKGVPLALAVQDGMTVEQVKSLKLAPEVVAVGGSYDWKWDTVAMWAAAFPRVHVLRCNAPARLYDMEEMGIESCDGTGWNMGDRKQTAGLEKWARQYPLMQPNRQDLWPYVCRRAREPKQESFA